MGPVAKAKAKAKADARRQLISKVSTVTATDASGNVFKGYHVWSRVGPDVKNDTLFVKCLVLPGSGQDTFKCRQIEPPSNDEEFEVPQSMVMNYNQNLDVFAFSDIGNLPHSNCACVLDFINQRFQQNEIYSTADPLLVAVNPFRNIGNSTDEIILKYRDAPDPSRLTPHTFLTARTALENLHMVKKSQTIIVSGESGAGKTEATKQIMRYFAAAKSGNLDFRIQKAVMAANPVLEAFGNAKTIRNNNSSRFGRFMMLQVAALGGIEYGTVKNFLLEKSRVITQDSAERNYHIFYQLLKGADAQMRKDFMLKDLKGYKYINPDCPDADGIDDVEEWKDVLTSFDSMGMNADEKHGILSIVSGVMLLGNVEIVEEERNGVDAGTISSATRGDFENACKLLFLDASKTEESLTVKISVAGGNEIRGCWNQKDVSMLKDSLAKAMFDKLFYWIIVKLNGNIEPEQWNIFMGMLDIFGFEVFQSNSLEQLFINITNEMLQKNFTDVVFDREMKLYRDEGISSADIKFTSNAAVIEMLTGKKASLMSILEDQCVAPGAADEKFLSTVWSQLKDNPKLIKPKLNSNVKFIVDHTIGDIEYTVSGFLFKNKDVLRPELIEVINSSDNCVAKELFKDVVIEKGKGMKGQFIASQFMAQLNELMRIINTTEPHFIRCVKPNEAKKPLLFEQTKVLLQLHSLSILEALQLRNLGYSYRRPFSEFLYQFKFIDLSITQNSSLDPREAASLLCERAGIKTGWQVGKTMLFLKPQAAKDMVKKQRESLAVWAPLITIIEAAFLRRKYKTERLAHQPKATRLQSLVRRKLNRKVAEPDYMQRPTHPFYIPTPRDRRFQ